MERTSCKKLIHVLVGYDNLNYGSKIEMSRGADGILPNNVWLKPVSKLRSNDCIDLLNIHLSFGLKFYYIIRYIRLKYS